MDRDKRKHREDEKRLWDDKNVREVLLCAFLTRLKFPAEEEPFSRPKAVPCDLSIQIKAKAN